MQYFFHWYLIYIQLVEDLKFKLFLYNSKVLLTCVLSISMRLTYRQASMYIFDVYGQLYQCL